MSDSKRQESQSPSTDSAEEENDDTTSFGATHCSADHTSSGGIISSRAKSQKSPSSSLSTNGDNGENDINELLTGFKETLEEIRQRLDELESDDNNDDDESEPEPKKFTIGEFSFPAAKRAVTILFGSIVKIFSLYCAFVLLSIFLFLFSTCDKITTIFLFKDLRFFFIWRKNSDHFFFGYKLNDQFFYCYLYVMSSLILLFGFHIISFQVVSITSLSLISFFNISCLYASYLQRRNTPISYLRRYGGGIVLLKGDSGMNLLAAIPNLISFDDRTLDILMTIILTIQLCFMIKTAPERKEAIFSEDNVYLLNTDLMN